MSFSSQVKDELSRVMPESHKQRIAELSALIFLAGRRGVSNGLPCLTLSGEHAGTARKYFTLLKKTYRIKDDLAVSKRAAGGGSHSYSVTLCGETEIAGLLRCCLLADGPEGQGFVLTERAWMQESGLRRAFLRGAFLAAGSISDPEKFYHLEFVCQGQRQAEFLRELFISFDTAAGIVPRKHSWIVYFKGSDQIVELLGIMEAPAALMELENIRIMKEMRNSVNRRVNCETANISKTVSAAVKQLSDIEYIRDTEGLELLPKNLAEMAEVRLRYPEVPLKELGQYLNPAVGKSGVNHRLRKLSEYAEQLRGKADAGVEAEDTDALSQGGKHDQEIYGSKSQ